MWLLLVATSWGLASGQEAEEPESDTGFFGAVDVQVINIDVHVTDDQGQPVPDLTLDDFELYEDGRPVAISDFFAVADGRLASTPAGGSPAVDEPAEPAAASPSPALPENQRLYLVIYVDNFNLHPLSRRWVIDGVEQFLVSYVRPEDQVMVVSYDRKLNLRTPGFTYDREQIAEALREATEVTAHAVNRDSERRRVLQEIDRAESPQYALSEARAHADFVQNEMGFGIDAIRDVVARLAGIDGRKALLHISDGIPMIAAEDLFLAAAERFQGLPYTEQFQYNMSRRFNQLTSQANAAGVTIYTLDARGLHGTESDSAEFDYANLRAARGLIDNTRDLNLQSSLIEMAADTGGQAILNTNALGPALRRLNQDLRTYYSLGYQPAVIDGSYHQLEVKVKRKGVKVRHRAGYRAKTRQTRVQESAVASLDFGLTSNPLAAAVRFGRGEASGDRVRVPVEITVPIGELTLIPDQGEYRGRLRVLVGIRDQRGDSSGVIPQAPADITVPEQDLEAARGQDFVYAFTLELEPKPQHVAITVVDDYGNAVSHLIEAVSPATE